MILNAGLIALRIVDETRQQIRFLRFVHLSLSSGAINDVVAEVRNDAHVVCDDLLGAEAECTFERPQRAEESRARVRLHQVERLGKWDFGTIAQTAGCLAEGNLGKGVECVAEIEILTVRNRDRCIGY